MKTDPYLVNALTVDLEDYYHVEAFNDVVAVKDWSKLESRIERNTERLLALFADRKVKGTFFILGWVAEHYPKLIRQIAQERHEIACHSYHHRMINFQSRREFRTDIRRAKALLEDISGNEVRGYRAPTYSITEQTLWALETLVEEGYLYDSSIFPIHHDRYGIPRAQRFPYKIYCPSGVIIEFPPTTLRVAGQNLPIAGGGYFRLIPYNIFRWGMKRINRCERQAAIFMVHAWEIDPGQPVIRGKRINIWRHRYNLQQTESRLLRLLDDFHFAPVSEVLRLGEAVATPTARQILGSSPIYAPTD
jgi:polysaccharide deacetylase family protein (PEP-CTERM system associated)